MKGLPTLVRVRKWELDEKRRKLADLKQLAERLTDALERLSDEVAHERTVAGESADVAHAYAPFAAAAIERKRTLEASKVEVEEQITQATEELRQAFQELKTFETAQAQRSKRGADERRRRDQNRLDEIAIETYRRS